MRLLFAFVLPAMEIAAGWLWLVYGVEAAGRILMFLWWLMVAFMYVATGLAGAIPGRPESANTSPMLYRVWVRLLFFVRVGAQVALGYPALGTFTLVGFLLSWLVFSSRSAAEKKPNGA